VLATRNLVLVVFFFFFFFFFFTPESRVLSTVLWADWNGRSVEQGLAAGVVMMLISSPRPAQWWSASFRSWTSK
jgi:hypothetical protein